MGKSSNGLIMFDLDEFAHDLPSFSATGMMVNIYIYIVCGCA